MLNIKVFFNILFIIVKSHISNLNLEYSWEYENYKYTYKSEELKYTYEKAEEYCKSQGGDLPHFEYEKFEGKTSVKKYTT